MFEQFVQYILGELRLIAEAPLLFGACVLFLGAIIWATLRWRYSGMIQRRNHIIALYKARLNGATPDQAKAKIDSLEGQVVSLKNREWPKLTPAAVADFESVLASQGSHVVLFCRRTEIRSFLPATWSMRSSGLAGKQSAI
jgi:hypothetical protein